MLASGSTQFEPVGTAPIKVIGHRFYRYKKHLDVNVKDARVRARAEVTCGRYNAISLVCGGRDCSRYPRSLMLGVTNKVLRG